MDFFGGVKMTFGGFIDLLLKIKTERMSVQVVRYGAATVVSFAVDVAILYILTEIAGLNYLVSAAISFMTGSFVNYMICAFWVFNQKRFESKSIEFSGFILIGFAGMGLNTALLWLFTDVAGLYYLWSRLISAVIGFFAKYLARKYALFTSPDGDRL